MKRIFQFLNSVKKRTLVLLVSATLLLSIAVGTTIAYIITKTDTHNNTFEPPLLNLHLEEIDTIKNDGNVPVYVRAISIANWLSTDDEHTISSDVPKINVDFEVVEFNVDGWFLASDGFYYYTKPLGANESVAIFTKIEQLKEKEGYELRVQFLSSSIQANPTDAVMEAWPAVRVNENGELVRADQNSDPENATTP